MLIWFIINKMDYQVVLPNVVIWPRPFDLAVVIWYCFHDIVFYYMISLVNDILEDVKLLVLASGLS